MQKYILLLGLVVLVSVTCTAQVNKLNKTYEISFDHASFDKVNETFIKFTGCSLSGNFPSDNFFVTLHFKATFKKILDTIFHPNNIDWKDCGHIISLALRDTSFTIQGIITDENSHPIAGASIQVKGTSFIALTNNSGNFTVNQVKENSILMIAAEGYKTQIWRIQSKAFLSITLTKNVSNMAEIQVIFDRSRKQKDSFSFNYPYKKTISSVNITDVSLGRNPDPDVYHRLNDQVSGFIINKNITPNVNQSSVSIRSRITISAYAEPLIVVDEMVYSGKLSDFNPDDIESISVLKDAAAASRWGVLSGNGVILVTTKKSDYLKKLQVYLNTSVIVGDYQNSFYLPRMSSPELIDFQTRLYKAHLYDYALSLGYPATSPIVEILYLKDNGLISESVANARINALANTDVRSDADKYLMQRSKYQHYDIGLSGGSAMHKYYYSMAFDKNVFNLIGDDYSRITSNLNNTFCIDKNGSEIYAGVYFMEGYRRNNGISYAAVHNNYEGLKDSHGNLLAQMQNLSGIYTDTAGGGRLPDWKFRLLDERGLSNNTIKNILLTATTGLNYKMLKGLEADCMFRYEKEYDDAVNKHSADSYFTRNMINSFTDRNSFVLHLPSGSINDENQNSRTAENMRVKINYSLTNEKDVLGVYAGAEIRRVRSEGQISRTYANNSSGSSGNIDYLTPFPLFYSFVPQKILYIHDNADTTENFYSVFAGAAYSYKDRYAASLTIRKDESNIFGVEANKKGVPFIAAGFSWDINQERFFHSKKISFLRLRLSDGYCGNVNKLISSQPIFSSLGNNSFGSPVSTVSNPENPDLRWERIAIFNAGLDFSAFKNNISGTVEYFIKNGADLIAPKVVDPTNGMTFFTGNAANMTGRGFDITINSMVKINKNASWQGSFLMSHATDKVINYKIVQPVIGSYCITELLNPLEGKPLYSIYGLKFERLDSANGDPIGYIDNHSTKDYSAIINSQNLNNLIYAGPATPTWFGTFRNTFTWKNLDFSFTIAWKAGYFFRRSSINYYNVMEGLSAGHPDYSKRWQHPGDEKITHVPSLTLLPDYARDFFYNYSTDLIERGDHIRLQNIRLSYRIHQPDSRKQGQPGLEVFLYANNIGLLWKANDKGIDPDYINSIPEPRSISIGLKANF